MTREEQFKQLENLFTLDIEGMGHFTVAFFGHYELLNNIIDKCVERFKIINIPRVDYFIYNEYVCVLYTQLSITIECLIKSILEENGYTENNIIKKGHKLLELLNELQNINKEKSNSIVSLLQKHHNVLNYFDSNNLFVNTRYMTYDSKVSLEHINFIKELILDLDTIYDKYYKNLDLEKLLYPDTI